MRAKQRWKAAYCRLASYMHEIKETNKQIISCGQAKMEGSLLQASLIHARDQRNKQYHAGQAEMEGGVPQPTPCMHDIKER